LSAFVLGEEWQRRRECCRKEKEMNEGHTWSESFEMEEQ
jgi:hypothetical protein